MAKSIVPPEDLDSQHPIGGSQPSVVIVSESLMPTSGLLRYQAHTWHTTMHAGKTPMLIRQ